MSRLRWIALGVVIGLVGAVGSGLVSNGAASSAPAAPDAELATFAGERVRPEDGKLGIIEFGAHPDDCEIRAGGVAALWSDAGHHVKFVSMTNGDVGHWKESGGALAKRREREVQDAARILGVTSEVLDIHDGELMPSLENRKTVIRQIRRWNADIVIAHRPVDYHPDHRYTGILMQDSAYMVTVPFLCPDTPPLAKNPVFLYSYDRFQRPVPFRADVVVSIDGVIDRKLRALAAIESQFVEGGCGGGPHLVPKTPEERAAAVRRVEARFAKRFRDIADRHRDRLIELYGEARGRRVRHAEAFEVCEYGRQPDPAELRRLFPFFGEE